MVASSRTRTAYRSILLCHRQTIASISILLCPWDLCFMGIEAEVSVIINISVCICVEFNRKLTQLTDDIIIALIRTIKRAQNYSFFFPFTLVLCYSCSFYFFKILLYCTDNGTDGLVCCVIFIFFFWVLLLPNCLLSAVFYRTQLDLAPGYFLSCC